MGVKIKDYIDEINHQKQEALRSGETSLTIRAGELHSKCRSKEAPSLIQCCSAMKHCMLEGDSITQDKECKTGASAFLTICYQLENMEHRASMYVPKKKGRRTASDKKEEIVSPQVDEASLTEKTITETYVMDTKQEEHVTENLPVEPSLKKPKMRTSDYVDVIQYLKETALHNGETTLIVRAGTVHSQYKSKDAPSLIPCCSAMKRCMLEGDEITHDKESKSGASAELTISFQLADMEHRAALFEPKKKGRPAGSKNAVKEMAASEPIIIAEETDERNEEPVVEKTSVRVIDYINEIHDQKQKALENGESSLTIQAGKLHAKCRAKKSPSLVQCCSAMKQCMLEGDEITQDKECKSGASTVLTICYQLENMENRAPKFAPKRKGRPAGSLNKKIITKKDELINPFEIKGLDEDQRINLLVENWMKKEKLRYENFQNAYFIDDAYGLWIIPKFKEGSNNDRFMSSITMIREDIHKCSIIFKDNESTREFWKQMSEEVIDRLNLTAFFVTRDGMVYQAL